MNPKLAVYAISLTSRSLRHLLEASLVEKGYHDFRIMEGVEAAHLNRQELADSGLVSPHALLSITEAACALSHNLVYRDFLLRSSADYCLIFEDDVNLDTRFEEIQALEIPEDCDFLSLTSPTGSTIAKRQTRCAPFGAYAYLISRRCASVFISLGSIKTLADSIFYCEVASETIQMYTTPKMYFSTGDEPSSIRRSASLRVRSLSTDS